MSPSAASTHTKHSRAHMHTHRVRLTRGLPTPRSLHKTANKARAQLVRPLSEAHISISGTRRHDRRAGRASRNRTKGCFQRPVGQTAANTLGLPDAFCLHSLSSLPINLFWAPGLSSVVCRRKLYSQGLPCDSTHICAWDPHTHWPSHTNDTLLCSQDAISLTPQQTTPNIHGHSGDGGADRAMLDASWKLSSEPVTKGPLRQIAFLC